MDKCTMTANVSLPLLPLLSLFIVFLLLPSPAAAVLLSPASTSLTVEPGHPYPFTITVTNDQDASIAVNLSADGTLTPSLALGPTSFTLAPGASRDIAVTFAAPEDLAPGRSDGRILVSASSVSQGQFGSAVTLAHMLHAYRAYAGAFLVATLRAPRTVVPGTATPLLVSLENKGDAATSTVGSVTVRAPNGTVVSETALPAVTIPGSGASKSEATLAPLEAGDYLLDAVVSYEDPLAGNTTAHDSAPIVVGTPKVTIGTPSGKLDPRGVSLLTVPVTLAWNTPRKLVATAETTGRTGQAVAPILVNPATPMTLKAYLETAGLVAATYDIHIIVRDDAGQLLGEATFPVETASSAPSKILPQTSWYVWLGALLLVLLILIIILWRHHRQ